MSELSDSARQSVAGKRSASPDPGRASPPAKAAKAAEGSGDLVPGGHDAKNSGTVGRRETKKSGESPTHGENGSAPTTTSSTTALAENADARPSTSSNSGVGPCTSSSGDAPPLTGEAGNGSAGKSDWVAMAAAEALASLTRLGEDKRIEQAHTSRQLEFRKKTRRKSNKRETPVARECEQSPTAGQSPPAGKGLLAQAAAADSSTSSPEGGAVDSAERQRHGLQLDRSEEEGEGSLSGSSSSLSSSSPSEEEAEDAECSIVSVKMAPETRQSVARLAQVQVQLDAVDRRSSRLHRRLELKLSQQRRPHLEQRSAIIRTIPGFWVTALLNHPMLSAHIDESDEEALSAMSHLEVESLKNTRMAYRISFHFNRNLYFQNTTIFKEFHVGLGGSMASFSSPILWHRGQDLTSQGPSGKNVSFFCWFRDHTEPAHDQIAKILKEDLYRNPLRYYLTPLWEPRENGSGHRAVDRSSGNECVVISDSEEDEDEGGAGRDDEEDADTGSGEGEQHDDSSDREDEEEDEDEEGELDVEELEEGRESSSSEVKDQEEELDEGRESSSPGVKEQEEEEEEEDEVGGAEG